MSAQQDFQRYLFINGRYQQSGVAGGFRVDQMRLVDNKKRAFIVLVDAIEDLQQHAIFSQFGIFPQFDDNQPEKGIGIQRGQVKIKRLIAILRQLMDKKS